MRHSERNWYVLPKPLLASFYINDGEPETTTKLIAFAFEDDQPIYLSHLGNIIRLSANWTLHGLF